MDKITDDSKISKISSKGQVVIPATIRKALQINSGDKLSITVSPDNEIILKKQPSELDWHNLVKDIPTEIVDVDKNGNYDPNKSPDFHDWMVNG
ncbi:AbrB/MazE/SpoVT family DNA-binding domain-containing protein [Companilactobacillus allii]|uniref:AbrB family transcriptional regulator n=1 Tax=Companilactobacillus allii TaxID=1847728 RepID=A0A1P8Q1A5_9LACO|nr:AbrB/MazE/SpoVT family DNA-binding domain-containing protein [Companilactobacillus allii]APX71662.1 AbrB family transcriptional regulator [Companilactobacillus allii]USQ68747.1 AbrB/MazE/SpoVT family DNA-binding domain-containing protein [Companilactobacillus allii]